MKHYLLLLFAIFSLSTKAQNWENLTFNDTISALNVNPVRGLIPGFNGTRNFPYSMEFFYLPLRGTMNNINNFNWTEFENKLEEIANRGNTAVPRFYMDYPGRSIATPQFLIDAGVNMKAYSNHGNDPNESKSPDYNDPRVMAALLNFIEKYGAKYNGDPRISVVQGGLIGFWGEWHNYPIGEQISNVNKRIIFEKFISAFPNTKINIRTPQNDVPTSTELLVGYHDDSFLQSTLGPTSWHFWPQITNAGLSTVWKNNPIGGEIYPNLQNSVWQAIPNTVGQNFETCVNTTHTTYMLCNSLFDDAVGSNTYKNALIQNRKLGYKFYVNGIKLNAAQDGQINIDVRLENKGVAPFYYNWLVEFGLVKSDSTFTSLGTANWNINTIQPNDVVEKNFTTTQTLQNGTYTIVMRFVNPLTALKPSAKQLSFANSTQNAHKNGWLSLKTFQKNTVQEQTWQSLTYNPNQPKLEYNPLKGFTTLWNPGNNFPMSIKGTLFDFDAIMTDSNTFNWAVVDTFINQQAREGRHSSLQVNIDPGPYSNGILRLPAFLNKKDANGNYIVERVPQLPNNANPDSTKIRYPDGLNWNNPMLMDAMLRFVDTFGKRYNNDPRVFMVALGLYGTWAEWHVNGPAATEKPEYTMTEANEDSLANAFKVSFPNANLMARYPANMPDPQLYGYSEGLFFYETVGDPDQYWYYFHNILKSNKADKNWMLRPIGGEVAPEVQSTILNSTPLQFVYNDNGGIKGRENDVDECIDKVHPTFLIYHGLLQGDQGNPSDILENSPEWFEGIRLQKRMGYTFYIEKSKLSASAGKPSVELNIQNKGVAPMYANWDVEFGVLDSSNQFTLLGTKKLNLNIIQPMVVENYRSFISNTTLADGTYKFIMRVVNPLEAYSTKATPVRFANTTQDADKVGWITLGQATITGGNLGVVPTAITSIKLTPDTATLESSQSKMLTSQVLPVNTTNQRVTYVSSHPATASVDSNGNVTTGSAYRALYGPVIITAYAQDDTLKAQSVITVVPFKTPLPAKIESEDFATSYGVNIENKCGTSCTNLGYIDSKDWIDYGVRVTTPNTFTVDFRVSSPNGGGQISLVTNTGDTLGTVDIPSTTWWENYTTVTMSAITMPQGAYELRVFVKKGGFNLDWMEFKNVTSSSNQLVSSNTNTKNENTLNDGTGKYDNLISLYPNPTKNWVKINVHNRSNKLLPRDINLFNALGKNVTPVIQNNCIIDMSHLPAGVYYLEINIKGEKVTKKIIKE